MLAPLLKRIFRVLWLVAFLAATIHAQAMPMTKAMDDGMLKPSSPAMHECGTCVINRR